MQKRLLSLSMLALLALSVGLGAGRAAGRHAFRGAPPVQTNQRSYSIAHRRALAPHIPGPRYDTSHNWSGYVATGSVSHVEGTWTVPTVTLAPDCPNAYSATWVGIDGWNSNTVEQLGTEQDYTNGVASYSAWWEMYPKGSATIPHPVNAGDSITASVTYDPTSGNFTLAMDDTTQSWHFEITQPLKRAQRSSAEWIEEAPFFGGILPLADFTQVNFTGCGSSIGGPGLGIPVTMVSNSHGRNSPHNLAEPTGAGASTASIKWDACR